MEVNGANHEENSLFELVGTGTHIHELEEKTHQKAFLK